MGASARHRPPARAAGWAASPCMHAHACTSITNAITCCCALCDLPPAPPLPAHGSTSWRAFWPWHGRQCARASSRDACTACAGGHPAPLSAPARPAAPQPSSLGLPARPARSTTRAKARGGCLGRRRRLRPGCSTDMRPAVRRCPHHQLRLPSASAATTPSPTAPPPGLSSTPTPLATGGCFPACRAAPPIPAP